MTTIRTDDPTPQFIPNGIATVEVSFYFPDRPLLLAPPLLWKTLDYYPDYPRVLRFLRFWKSDIEAAVERILLTHELSNGKREISVDELPRLLH